MKFESKYGIGEICIYNENKGASRVTGELLVKVTEVFFGDTVQYGVEYVSGNDELQRFIASEASLTGDPEFDQEKGCYPQKEGYED